MITSCILAPKTEVMAIHPLSWWAPNLPVQDTHLANIAWDSDHHDLFHPHYKQLHKRTCTQTKYSYSRMVRPPVSDCANEKMERLLDECREVQEYEHRGVQCLAWTTTAESDGVQLLPKVVESN